MNINKMKKAELIKYIRKLENDIQDLNIRLKYALFDSEAGQREIKYYKELLRKKDEEK